MGVLGLLQVGVVLALVVFSEPSVVGLRVALAAAAVGVVVWMVLLRPRVNAYAETLHLRNVASDVHLPLARIDSAVVRHALNVWVDGQRYTCPGIGRSSRNMLKSQGRGAASESAERDYATFVETTIDELSRSARRDLRGDPPPVTRRWALPELAAIAALTLTFAASFLLR
jgi:hypothetical protein